LARLRSTNWAIPAHCPATYCGCRRPFCQDQAAISVLFIRHGSARQLATQLCPIP